MHVAGWDGMVEIVDSQNISIVQWPKGGCFPNHSWEDLLGNCIKERNALQSSIPAISGLISLKRDYYFMFNGYRCGYTYLHGGIVCCLFDWYWSLPPSSFVIGQQSEWLGWYIKVYIIHSICKMFSHDEQNGME